MTQTEPKRRLSAAERREQILAAATQVFGAVGAAGTTDAVAKAAGISQAYVVRTFGSKENLLMEVAGRARDRVAATFRAEIAAFPPEATSTEKMDRMGHAYKRLMADRGLLLALRHVYTMGHDAVVGPSAREGFLSIYRLIRDEAGLSPDEAMRFMAQGMLIDTLLTMRITEANDPAALELLCCALEVDAPGLSEFRSILEAPADVVKGR